ncbi:hypothetical protein Hamer_G003446, partial [Homarus americanus]
MQLNKLTLQTVCLLQKKSEGPGKQAKTPLLAVMVARESDIKNGLLQALNLNRDVFNKKTWLLCAANATQSSAKDLIQHVQTTAPQHRGSPRQQSSTFYKLGQERLT